MPLNSLHLLLSYQCTYECDHCFVWSSPHAGGTMSLELLRSILAQAEHRGGIEKIYFEGGEPFLLYPLLVEGLRQARECGFATGVVTNAYWATSAEDAALWLEPLVELGVDDLSVSSDTFHGGEAEDPRPAFAVSAAEDLGLTTMVFTIIPPTVCESPGQKGGRVRFRGRAAAKLAADHADSHWADMTECPDEDFRDSGRVHVDGLGNVHLCQGILMGNLRETPLREMLDGYRPDTHPIIRPLLEGGPAELVRHYRLPHDETYADPCHLCYEARSRLREQHPGVLGPAQVYGPSE